MTGVEEYNGALEFMTNNWSMCKITIGKIVHMRKAWPIDTLGNLHQVLVHKKVCCLDDPEEQNKNSTLRIPKQSGKR